MEVMKQLRQRAIRDLVEQRAIHTQQELAAALRERGFRTTQATISRDVAELGLIKRGREHLHHLLLQAGLSQRGAVLSLYLLAVILALVALDTHSFAKLIALIILFGVMVVLIASLVLLGRRKAARG